MWKKFNYLDDAKEDMLGMLPPPSDEEDEEEMLKRAVAMSLEEVEQEEGLCSTRHHGAGELLCQNTEDHLMILNFQMARWKIMTMTRRC